MGDVDRDLVRRVISHAVHAFRLKEDHRLLFDVVAKQIYTAPRSRLSSGDGENEYELFQQHLNQYIDAFSEKTVYADRDLSTQFIIAKAALAQYIGKWLHKEEFGITAKDRQIVRQLGEFVESKLAPLLAQAPAR